MLLIPSLRPELYRQYASALFNALPVGPNGADLKRLDDVMQSVEHLPSNPLIVNRVLADRLRKKFDYKRQYFPENGNYSDNRPTGADDLGILSKNKVDALITRIRNGCCPK